MQIMFCPILKNGHMYAPEPPVGRSVNYCVNQGGSDGLNS